MPAPQYLSDTEGTPVALAAGVAKTVVGVKAHANSGLMLCGFTLGFDGISAAAVPALVEVCYCTWATNSPGTASTGTTIRQLNGRSLTAGFTGGRAWTTEPTVLTHIMPEFTMSPNGGNIVYNWPLGTEPDSALAEGFAIRLKAPAVVNISAGLIVSRI
jgi:hypothetical protein